MLQKCHLVVYSLWMTWIILSTGADNPYNPCISSSQINLTNVTNYNGTIETLNLSSEYNPCFNGGICVTIKNDTAFECKCIKEFSGEFCQFGNPCASSPCMNGGTCQFFEDSGVCHCLEEFYGVYCEQRNSSFSTSSKAIIQTTTDESISTPQSYTNISNPEGYRSSGYHNFKLPRNSYDDDLASSKDTSLKQSNSKKNYTLKSLPKISNIENQCLVLEGLGETVCFNGGKCYPIDNLSFECECPKEYTGEYCQFLNACINSPCLNGGTCIPFEDSGVCDCLREYKGNYCEKNIVEIETMKPSPTDYVEIEKIEIEVINSEDEETIKETTTKISSKIKNDPCNVTSAIFETLCMNAGICNSLSDKTYECQCPDNFTGQFCQFKNACAKSPCKNGGTCEAYEDSGVCSCPIGFTGIYCEFIDDRDSGKRKLKDSTTQMTPLTNDPCNKPLTKCQNNGKCIVIDDTTHECECLQEFSGTFCQFKNPCREYPCKNGGTCEVFQDSGVCNCIPGFQGTYCEHEIPKRNAGYEQKSHGPTKNHTHVIKRSYDKTSKLDPCDELEGEGPRCYNDGICISLEDQDSSFKCECLEKFRGSICEFVNACALNPCKNGGTCESYEDSGVCSCPMGFEGIYCEMIDDVTETYVNRLKKGRRFPAKFVGLNKEVRVNSVMDHCDNSEVDDKKPTCINGGRCILLDEESYECECTIGFTGQFCQFLDVCGRNPCVNGGTCESFEDSGICVCSNGFTGIYCEEKELKIRRMTVDDSDLASKIPKENQESVLEHIYRSKIPPKLPYPMFLQMKARPYYNENSLYVTATGEPKDPVISIPGFEDISKNMIRLGKDGTIYIRKPKKLKDKNIGLELNNEQQEQPDPTNKDSSIIQVETKDKRILDASIVKVMPNGELFIKVLLPKHQKKHQKEKSNHD